VACELYEASTPYFPFRALFRTLFGVPDDATSDDVGARLRHVVATRAPDLAPWLPLLAIPLDIELPATEETAQLEDRFRRQRLHDVAFRLLKELLGDATLLVVEDAHWMDEASADLLRYLAAWLAETPWLVCVTRREAEDGFSAEADAAHTTVLRLAPLDIEAATALAVAATDDAPLPQHETAVLVKRSGGNPLFLRALIGAARAAGGVDELPDSIESLVTARIDQLSPLHRNVLRHVSVLGQSFTRDLASAVLSEDASTDDERTWRGLSEFLAREDGTIRFRNALIRDAAYEGLPYRLRRRLHAKIGNLIEAAAGDSADDQAGLLSFHFFHAQHYPEAWRYSLAAAERASAIYANADAGELYQRAIDAARRVPDLGRLEVSRVYELLGDVRDHMGAYRDAAAAYRSARRLLPHDPVAEARLMLKQGQMHGWLSKYSQALRWIRRGLHRLDGIDTQDAGRQRAHLMAWYAQFCEMEGRHAAAINWCHRAVEEATASGARAMLAHAYKVLDWAYANLGQLEKSTNSARALAIYEELADLPGQAAVLNNMGGFARDQARWEEALKFYRRALEICQRIGDEIGVAGAKYNMGLVFCDQGRLTEAETLLRAALRIWQAAGYRASVAYAESDLGRVAARSGDHEAALRLLEAAHSEFVDVGARQEAVYTLAAMAESHVLRGDGPAALAVAGQALEQSDALGGVSYSSPSLRRIRAYAFMQVGELDAAGAALRQSLADARLRKADYDVALTLRALIDLGTLERTPVPESLEDESRAILQRLGVVHIPEVPLKPGRTAAAAVSSQD
jgi:tetratricopeptide (TPR) repeat protein